MILIIRIKFELTECKKAVEHRLEVMAAEDRERNESWDRLAEKGAATKEKVEKAQQAIPGLLELISIHLGRESGSDDQDPGSRKNILAYMIDYLSPVVNARTLSLLQIMETSRSPSSTRAIYREDFDNLPREVVDKFNQMDKMITKANQATREEELETNKHKELLEGDYNEAQFEKQHEEEQERLKAIISAEAVAKRVMDAGTIWNYERKPVPGENKRKRISNETASNLLDALKAHINELDNASLEGNLHKLKREILKANEYVKSLKPSLTAYNNTEKVEEVITDVEISITMTESEVRRLQNSTNKASRRVTGQKDPMVNARSNAEKQDETMGQRLRGNTTEDLMDTVFQEKRTRTHMPLPATPAGQHTTMSSMKPLSTKQKKPDQGGDNNDQKKRKGGNDDDNTPPQRMKRNTGDDDDDDPNKDGGHDGSSWRSQKRSPSSDNDERERKRRNQSR